MTQSEKNTSNSEISVPRDPIDNHIICDLKYNLNYAMLTSGNRFEYVFTTASYFNLLVFSQRDTITYSLKGENYILNSGENILHFASAGARLTLFITSNENQVLFISLPSEQFAAYHEKSTIDPLRFINGLLTKSDNRVHLILTNIFSLQEPTAINKLKLEAQILELLVRQIEVLYVENDQHEVIENKNHFDKIMLARKIIESDLTKSYSIAELAKEVGTNEQYLKKYFKQYFHKTIQNYITDKKMEYAKDLIVNGDLRVTDVARLTGYKHATHFTTAFKKHFGFIPNSLRYTFLMAHEGINEAITIISDSGISNII